MIKLLGSAHHASWPISLQEDIGVQGAGLDEAHKY